MQFKCPRQCFMKIQGTSGILYLGKYWQNHTAVGDTDTYLRLTNDMEKDQAELNGNLDIEDEHVLFIFQLWFHFMFILKRRLFSSEYSFHLKEYIN